MSSKNTSTKIECADCGPTTTEEREFYRLGAITEKCIMCDKWLCETHHKRALTNGGKCDQCCWWDIG